ncbi:MAG: DUF4365 domain-containing protein [Saprospiraceae bacterium]
MRKLRTRQHIIEDLGFNQVERQVLLAGCTVQRMFHDYGYDGFIHLYNERGEYANGFIKFQLKSTDKLKAIGETCAIDLSKRDLELWLLSPQPVVLFLYDAAKNMVYFTDLRDYFEENRMALRDVRKFVRVYIPLTNVFDSIAMQRLKASTIFE